MGWAFCGKGKDGREMGYGVVATCDFPGCEEKICRGLGYLCGDMHEGELQGENDGYQTCGGYFCKEHTVYWSGPNHLHNVCHACEKRLDEEMKENGDIDCLEKEDREMIATLGWDDA